mmetsp:Transcript_56266/g.138185  ORF Transcript_56266/g.138185 Transcript_56266/m.138185 type:complete len:678 (+) Transcript_56266:1235-3268(+)
MAAGGKISASFAEMLALVLIGINLAATVLLHWLEKWAAERHMYLQTVLRIMYRELMMLGLVSFGFLTVEILWSDLEPDVVVSFEFAHALIFALAILYATTVVFSNYTSVRLSRQWKSAEALSLEQYLAVKTRYRTVHDLWMDPKTMPLRRWAAYWENRKLHAIINFHDLRFQFIFYRGLPENFNFTAYLRNVKATVYTHLVDIHWTLWALALVFEAFDLARRHIVDSVAPSLNPRFDAGLICFFVVFDIAWATLLTRKIRVIHKTLAQNPATYYNDHMPLPSEADVESARDDDVPSVPDSPSRVVSDAEMEENSHATSRVRSVDGQESGSQVAIFTRLYRNAKKPAKHKRRASIDQVFLQQYKEAKAETEQASRAHDDLDLLESAQPAVPEEDGNASSDGGSDEHGYHARHAMSFDLPFTRMRPADPGVSALVAPRQQYAGSVRTESNLSGSSSARQSVDVAAYVPVQELEERRNRELSDLSSQEGNSARKPSVSMSERPSIVVHHEGVRAAAQMEPERNFPRWLLLIVPRLKRVASPVEKLFWFGSHRFFLWSVQLSLFVATFSTAVMVAAVAVSASSFRAINWAGLAVSILSLIWALLCSASSLKTYTFVINASSLVSEELVEDAVDRVVDKRALKFRTVVREIASGSMTYDSDTDQEDGRRKKGLWRRALRSRT